MKLEIDSKEFELRPRAAVTLTELNYEVTYDNSVQNGVGVPPGRCVIKFTPVAQGAPGTPPLGLSPITISGSEYQALGQWDDSKIESAICARLGVTKRTET